jgi:hypothetical protein
VNQKALCFFTYWHRRAGVTEEHTDAVVIGFTNKRNIPERFHAKIRAMIPNWKVGPTPTLFELDGYLTDRGEFARSPKKSDN